MPSPPSRLPDRPAVRTPAISRAQPGVPNPMLWPTALHRLERLSFRRAPLLGSALALIAGELLAHLSPHPVVLLAIAGTLLLALALFAVVHAHHQRHSAAVTVALPALALWLSAGMLALQLAPTPDPQLALRPFADNLSRTVVGTVLRTRPLPPRTPSATADAEHIWQPDAPDPAAPAALQVDLALSRVEQLTPDVSTLVPISGGVRITLLASPADSALPLLHCGQLLQLDTRLRLPERFRDPGAWQYADYLLAQGIGAHGTAFTRSLTLLPATGSGVALRCRLLAAQAWAADRLQHLVVSAPNRHLPALLRLTPDDAGMLAAMLVGDRSGLNRQLRLGFERTGSFHLFVVSGMHVALLAGLLFTLFRRLRLSALVATLLTLPVIMAYALVTGFAEPVQRALLMTTVFLLARLLSRKPSSPNALGAAVLVALLLSPTALFTSSFQMTCLAVIAIAGIAVPLSEHTLLPTLHAFRQLSVVRLDQALPPREAQLRVTLRLVTTLLSRLLPGSGHVLVALLRLTLSAGELALIGLVAELSMALPMAVYFHRATLFALPANLLSVPLVGVLLPSAILTFAAALVSPALAVLPGAVTALLLHGITLAISHLSRAPLADARVPPPSALVIGLALLLLAACCFLARQRRPLALTVFALLPLTTLLVLWPEPALLHPGLLEVTAIDVGQGDSLLLAGADGRTMLVDAGGPTGSITEAATATAAFDVGEEVVAPYLWSRRIRRLDTLVLSHAHSDHMGGMPAVLRDLRPRELWVSLPAHAEAFTALLEQAHAQGTVIRYLHAGESFPWGPQHVDVLAPDATYSNPGDPRNDDSLVLRVRLGKASVLLAGDAEAASEQAMLASGKLAPVTLLKVGHHGSLTSSTPPFLAAVAPAQAVISTGLGNHFGHPRPEILARLADAHTRTFRTDEFGLTTFLLHPDGSVTTTTGTPTDPTP